MDKIQELKKLKDLLDNNIVNEQEFEKMKKEILSDSISKSTPDKTIINTQQKKGELTISFPGQWFLFDAKIKLFVNKELHSTHSIKKGFSVQIPITSSDLNLKVILGGMKSTVYEINELKTNENYELELVYDDTWGKFSKKFNFTENG